MHLHGKNLAIRNGLTRQAGAKDGKIGKSGQKNRCLNSKYRADFIAAEHKNASTYKNDKDSPLA
jgi:hypothetical protein